MNENYMLVALLKSINIKLERLVLKFEAPELPKKLEKKERDEIEYIPLDL